MDRDLVRCKKQIVTSSSVHSMQVKILIKNLYPHPSLISQTSGSILIVSVFNLDLFTTSPGSLATLSNPSSALMFSLQFLLP